MASIAALPMALLASMLLPLLMLFHLVGPVPTDLGVHGGELSPCPGPEHCAQARWSSDDLARDWSSLTETVEALPRTTVVEHTDTYLHAEVSSALFGFVDDLELHATEGMIQARSISRLGDSDLGVNARRLAELRS